MKVRTQLKRRLGNRRWFDTLEDRMLLTVQPLTLAAPSFAGASAYGMSSNPTMSSDGQLVAFKSDADNLVPNDTNGSSDVFVYNRSTNVVSLISVALNGLAAGSGSLYSAPVISPDGRYVAFESSSTNALVAGITGDQIYLRDLQTQQTTLITRNAAGTGGAAVGVHGLIFSGDSKNVLLVSSASSSQNANANLTMDPIAPGYVANIFKWNVNTNQTTLVTASLTGVGDGIASGNGVLFNVNFAASADGRYVVFLSDAANYVAADSNTKVDVFVRDTVLNTTALASINRFGNISAGNSGLSAPSLSADGRYVAFVSDSTDLTTVNPNGGGLVYVRDLQAGVTTAVSVKADGTTMPSFSVARSPRFSADGRVLVFTESAGLVAADTNNLLDVYAYDQSSRTVSLVSATASGGSAAAASGSNPNADAPTYAVSDDGRYVFFRSGANNLVSGIVSPPAQNLFRRDLLTQTTQLISIPDPAGTGATADSDTTAISSDGRFVAFQTMAANLVVGDTNYRQDVFVRDLTLGETELASPRTPLLPPVVLTEFGGTLESSTPDGRFVVFTSQDGVRHANAFPSDYQPTLDVLYETHVLVRDTQTGAVEFIDLNPDGSRALGGFNPLISDDGRYVFFVSYKNLDAAHANNNTNQIFVRDRQTNTTTMVSRSTTGGPANGAIESHAKLAISPDGRYVVWGSTATDLVAAMTNNTGSSPGNLFIYDRIADTTKLVSHLPGQPTQSGNSPSLTPVFSPDGAKVAFVSRATDLAAGITDTNSAYDLFVYDVVTGNVTCASVTPAGTATGNGRSAIPTELDSTKFAFSANGQFIYFGSAASNLVATDTNNRLDIFRRDLVGNATLLVSANAAGTDSGNNDSVRLSISNDGQRVAYMSHATNLIAAFTPGNFSGEADIFVRDFGTGQTTLVSGISATNGSNNHSQTPIISPNGRYVSFLSHATNLLAGFVDGNTNSNPDLYIRDLNNGRLAHVTTNQSGTAGGSAEFIYTQPDVRQFSNGNRLYFNSYMPNLVAGDRNGIGDVFAFTPGGSGIISGNVFGDTSGDGSLDGAEVGLPFWSVFLDANTNGQFDANETLAITDAAGNFRFANLLAGTYTVAVVPQINFVQTAPLNSSARTVILASDIDVQTGKNFGQQLQRSGLAVTSVLAPVSATLGGTIASVRWTVQNNGSRIEGDWQDAIYLSLTPSLTSNSILLRTVPHTGGLASLASYTEFADLTVPTLPPGSYYIIVETDRRGQVAQEANRADNVRASASSIALDVPTIVLGQDFSADSFVRIGQELYYKLIVPSTGGSLALSLTPAGSTGQTSLYLRRGTPPTAWDYDARSLVAGPNQALVLPAVSAGTYYVMARAEIGVAFPSPFVLRAEIKSSLDLLSSTPSSGGNSGRVTVEIRGINLSPNTTAKLVLGVAAIAAETLDYRNPGLIYATFNLTGTAIGTYNLELHDGVQTDVLAGAFNVVAGVQGTVSINLIVPDFIRYERPNTLVVEYTNTGNTDIVSPLLEISSAKALFRQPVDPNFVFSSIQVLATPLDGPAGILRPGQTGRISIPIQSNTPIGHDQIQVDVKVVTSGETIDWNALELPSRPPSISSEAWHAVWANFKAMVGTTTDSYNARLAQAATYLGSLGAARSDINRIYAFLIGQADASFPATTLASAVDAAVSAPGLPLTFTRSFGASISDRYQSGLSGSGMFGYGWKTVWDAYGARDLDTNQITFDLGGSTLVFSLQRDGTYRGASGDGWTLKSASQLGAQLVDPSGNVWTFEGDFLVSAFTFKSIADPNGNRITRSDVRDASANLLSTKLTHSNGQELTITYTVHTYPSLAQVARPTQIVDGAGRITTFTYDASWNHLVSATDEQGTTLYEYVTGEGLAKEHALKRITLPDGSHIIYTYDFQGRIANISRDNGAESTTFEYLGEGKVRTTNALGHSSIVWFNEFGQAEQIQDANGSLSSFDYDNSANLTRFVDAGGRQFRYAYDSRGNVTSIINPLGRTVSMQYTGGAYDRLSKITDARGNATDYDYDSHGNMRSITYPNGGQETFRYDPLGNLSETVNRRGQAINNVTDTRGRVTQTTFVDLATQTFVYDAFDNLTSTTDATGTTTLEYDDATNDPKHGRLTKITYPSGRYLVFTYDSVGRRIKSVDQDGFAVRYEYDTLGRLIKLTDDAAIPNLIVEYTYDLAGRLTQKDNGNGTSTLYAYDPAGQLLRIENSTSTNALNSVIEYTYDALGRRITMTDDTGTTAYEYDDIGQLTKVTQPGPRTIEYTYDAAGNRSRVVDSLLGTTAYTADNENQITQIGSDIYTYDADGNLVSVTDNTGTTTYTFNSANQMTGFSGPGGTSTFEYDALGFRTAATRNGTRTDYLIDPAGLGNVVGAYGAGNTLIANYVHGLGLVGQFGPSGTGYYDFDGAGNTIGITGAAQSYVNRYRYLPFGETIAVAAALPNPFTFVGQFGVMQEVDDMSYMRARYFMSDVAQFVSVDPIGLSGGDANQRRYSANNPVSFVDPSGFVFYGTVGIQAGVSPALLGPSGAVSYTITEDGDVYLTEGYGIGTTGVSMSFTGGNGDVSPGVGRNASIASGTELVGVTANVGADKTGRITSADYGLSIGYQVPGVSDLRTKTWRFGKIDPTLAKLMLVGPYVYPFKYLVPEFKALFEPLIRRAIENLISSDPNDIIGPAGFGPQNFIRPIGTWSYTINFENKPSASAPAQEVRVTHQLDSDLDWTTFQLGSFGFGAHSIEITAGLMSYQTSVDAQNLDGSPVRVDVAFSFNRQTGLFSTTFLSIDPKTGTFPLDAFAGFLPPDDASNRGKGFIQYTISPKTNLATGTAVSQQASIVFDANEPIETPVFTNTIDGVAPTSAVNALPGLSAPRIALSWFGSDDAGGSGLTTFDVFMAIDGGPFQAFLLNTVATSTVFIGSPGHTYSFYVVAVDNLGNRQAAPATAQAIVKVVGVNVNPPSNLTAVAAALSHSDESYTNFIVSAYNTYLGRGPDAAGLNAWLALMRTGQVSDEQLEAQFVGSPEYIVNHGGAGAGWVTGMYVDLLGRSPAQNEVNSWVAELNAGVSPVAVAFGFAASIERQGIRVRQNYQTYLGRTPTPIEVDSWVDQFINHGMTTETMAAGFVGSAEFFNNPTKGASSFSIWVEAAYQAILARSASPSDVFTVTNGLSLPANIGVVAAQLTHSDESFTNFIIGAYNTYLGRGPDAAGLDAWLALMRTGQVSDEQLEAQFVGSPEYIVNHGGAGAGWVTGMYVDLLGRSPAQIEVDGWVARLDAGVSPVAVAYGFAASAEREGNRVRQNYQTYLGRTPAQSEVDSWVDQFINHGMTSETMAAGFVASQEYFLNAHKGKGSVIDWLDAAFAEIVRRSITEAELLAIIGVLR